MNQTPQPATSALTFTQQKVIALLADGLTTVEIARECEIHRSTIHNWRRYHPGFIAALADAHTDAVEDWHARTQQLGLDAIVTLCDILRHDDHPSGVRLKAALHVLESVTTRPADRQQQQLRARNRYAKKATVVEVLPEPRREQVTMAGEKDSLSSPTTTLTSTDFDTFSEQQDRSSTPISGPATNSTQFDTFSKLQPVPNTPGSQPRPRQFRRSQPAKTPNRTADRATTPFSARTKLNPDS